MAQRLGYITVGYIDTTEVPASTRVFVTFDDTATLATLITEANAIAGAESALSEDSTTEAKMTVFLTNPNPSSGIADSDSQEGLLLNYLVTGSRYPQEIWIPALIDALLVNGKIDLTNTTLLNFEAALASQTHITPTNAFAIALTTLRDAAESFRKLKRLATKKSRSRS